MSPLTALFVVASAGLLAATVAAVPMRLDPAAISASVEDRRNECPRPGTDAIADLLRQLETPAP